MSRMDEIDKILESIKELREAQKLTDEQLRKTDEQLCRTDAQFRKTDEELGRTDQQIKELREAQKLTDEQLRRTDERLDRLGVKIGELTGGWGRFVEDLMAPGIQAEFNRRGLRVNRRAERLEAKDNGQVLAEYDIVLFGKLGRHQNTVVLVSVKSRVRAQDIKELIQSLDEFQDYCPEYRSFVLMGAIAGVGFANGAIKNAERQGLFAIRSSEGVASIVNSQDFKPKVWPTRKSRRK